jgi:hypothetical protein
MLWKPGEHVRISQENDKYRGTNLIGRRASKEFMSNVSLVATRLELANPGHRMVNGAQSIRRREETDDVVGLGSLVFITEPTHVYKSRGEVSEGYLTE